MSGYVNSQSPVISNNPITHLAYCPLSEIHGHAQNYIRMHLKHGIRSQPEPDEKTKTIERKSASEQHECMKNKPNPIIYTDGKKKLQFHF